MKALESLCVSLTSYLQRWVTIETLTLLLVIITAFYAWTTFKMLKANREIIKLMSDELEYATRPHIVAQIEVKPGYPLLFLKIKNTGKTAALNLKLTLHQPFFELSDRNIQEFSAFSQVIESFPPETYLEFVLIEGPNIFNNPDQSRTPLNFDITAKYSFSNRTVEDSLKIDLNPFCETIFFQDSVSRHLKDISRSLSKIADK